MDYGILLVRRLRRCGCLSGWNAAGVWEEILTLARNESERLGCSNLVMLPSDYMMAWLWCLCSMFHHLWCICVMAVCCLCWWNKIILLIMTYLSYCYYTWLRVHYFFWVKFIIYIICKYKFKKKNWIDENIFYFSS